MSQKKITPAEAEAMARADKRKLILMTLGVFVLGIGYLTSNFFGQKFEREEQEAVGAQLPTEQDQPALYVPEFDEAARASLAGIQDATKEDRVLMNSEALDSVFTYAQLLTERHYEALGVRSLDEAAVSELSTDPEAHRIEPFRARGMIADLEERERKPGQKEWRGSLILEDQANFCHFVVSRLPEGAQIGHFLRVDGVFLKMHRSEGPNGWMEGPMLIGFRGLPTYANVGSAEALTAALAEVRDDELFDESGNPDISGIPFDAKWGLMRKAMKGRELGIDGGDTDWENAPELTSETLNKIFQDGEAYRGKPFRLSISRNVGSWVKDPRENPLRLEQVTTGWIGNMTWKGNATAIHWIGPFHDPGLQDFQGASRLITGRGYFLKNWLYEKRDGDPVACLLRDGVPRGLHPAPRRDRRLPDVGRARRHLLPGGSDLVPAAPGQAQDPSPAAGAHAPASASAACDRPRPTRPESGPATRNVVQPVHSLPPVARREIEVRTERPYVVYVSRGELDRVRAGLEPYSKVACIADARVLELHGHALEALGEMPRSRWRRGGQQVLRRPRDLLEFLAGAELDRRSCVLAFGGGVIGDLAGWRPRSTSAASP